MRLLPSVFCTGCFNTQPPEGGWVEIVTTGKTQKLFQHTAARRRLDVTSFVMWHILRVSTHSRPKAAGFHAPRQTSYSRVSTHSRPKAAGCKAYRLTFARFGFNTQPPEGGWNRDGEMGSVVCGWFQHTAARRRLGSVCRQAYRNWTFQHTAARRRLVFPF